VLETAQGLVLIDSGQASAASREHLAAALDGMGRGLRDVRHVLVTHIHRDHYTLAVELRREFGSRISLGVDERPSLEQVGDASRDVIESQLRMLVGCGAQSLVAPNAGTDDGIDAGLWEEPDTWLDRDRVAVGPRTLQTIPTPGHTRGHVVFRDETGGLLFAGDHVLPHITPSIGFEPAVPDLPLGDYIRSLQLVRSLPDTWLLPAHGHTMRSVYARVDELLDHHADRLDAAAACASAGDVSAFEVAGRLTWTRRARSLNDLSPFNRMLAVLETKAHLDVLVERGRLRNHDDGGTRRYST